MERGDTHQITCPRCNAPVKAEELKQIFPGASDVILTAVASVYTKYMEDMKMNTCWNKAHFFAQARVESGKNFMIGHGESFNYYWEDLTDGKFPPFTTTEGRKKAKEWGRAVKKRSSPGYIDVPEGNQKKIAEYIYGPDVAKGKELGNTQIGDGWRFRGKGLIQLTGRSNYTKINTYCKKYDELGDIIANSDLLLEVEMAVFSSMAYWHMKSIYNDANGRKNTKAACEKVGKDLAVKDEEGKNSKNHIEKQKMFDKYASVSFKVDDCLWGKVKDGLKFDNSDLKIQQGIDWLLTKAISQEEVKAGKSYIVKYANDQNRTSESGENTMDCSELVCRYLQKIEWSSKVMAGNTRLLHGFAEKYPEYLQKHDNLDYKPQKGDIFIWKNKSGGMGHTGVIIDYDETTDVVTTIEAISSKKETPYGMSENLNMKGVIKLKWKRKSSHLLDHAVTAQRSPCRFYTPKVHYSKVDKKVRWSNNDYSFVIKKK